MIIIKKPSKKANLEYFSDFSNKSFGDFFPHVVINFEFNYGSKFDGETIQFHFTDEEAAHVLDFIKMNLSQERFNQMKNNNENIFIDDYNEKY